MSRNHYIELVGKIFRVVETLRDHPEGMSLQELAEETGYVKSSIHRILQSLKRHGYIEQESQGNPYHLGLQFLTLARALEHRAGLLQMARPYLRELVNTFNESAYLALLKGGRGIFVDVQETRRDLRLFGPLGAEVHYHATAAGKVIAAYLDRPTREALLRRIEPQRLSDRTLTDRESIEREWDRVRQNGYAVNDEETIVGAVFLAAPIFDSARRVCGGVSVGIPKARYSGELGERVADAVQEACRKLSELLDRSGYVHDDGIREAPSHPEQRTRDLPGGDQP